MTHKLKLLLFGLLVLLSVSISNTYAITFVGHSTDISALSIYEGKTLVDQGYGYLSCIDRMNPTASNLTIDMRCSENIYKRFGGSYYWPGLSLNGYGFISNGDYHFLVESGTNHIFTMMKLDYEDKPKYVKVTMRNLMTKMLNVKSQRGEHIYDFAVVDGLGFSLRVKDEDQVRAAQVIANSYILDGYILVASSSNSYLLDTYTNKLYGYNSQFYTDSMQKMGATGIFPKLRNVVPDNVWDIVWNMGSSNLHYSSSDAKLFDHINQREGKKSDLAELRENLKKSIVILNEEHAEYFLGQTPESLGIGTGQPNTDNQLNTSGSTTPKTGGAEEKKACVDYYTKMKAFTAHSNGCRGETTSGEQFEYRKNIVYGTYEQYNTWDKARYWRCSQFASYREKMQKEVVVFGDFLKDWEERFHGMEVRDIDINALCSHITISSSNEGDINSPLNKFLSNIADGMNSVNNLVFNDNTKKVLDGVYDTVRTMSFGLIDLRDPMDKVSDSVASYAVNKIHGNTLLIDENGNSVAVSKVYADKEELAELKYKMEDLSLTESEREIYRKMYEKKKVEMTSTYRGYSSTGFISTALGSGFKQGVFKEDSKGLFKDTYYNIRKKFNEGRFSFEFTNKCEGGYFPLMDLVVKMMAIFIGFYLFRLFKNG